ADARAARRQPNRIRERRAQGPQGHPARAVGGRGREDVAGVERPADRRAAVARVLEHDPPGPRDLEAEPEEAVVRADEAVAAGRDRDRAPGGPDSRVHHRQVDGPAGEDAPCRGQELGPRPDVLRGHGVSEIHEPGGGVDPEDDTLDGPHVGVVEAEVGQERHDAAPARRPAAPHRSRWITYSPMSVRTSRAADGGRRASWAVAVAACVDARATAYPTPS